MKITGTFRVMGVSKRIPSMSGKGLNSYWIHKNTIVILCIVLKKIMTNTQSQGTRITRIIVIGNHALCTQLTD